MYFNYNEVQSVQCQLPIGAVVIYFCKMFTYVVSVLYRIALIFCGSNFANFANLESFTKLIQQKFDPLQFEPWATRIREFF